MPQTPLFSIIGGKVVAQKCNLCILGSRPGLKTNCMSGLGPSSATFMIVGVAPGDEDDRLGVPYSGPTGRLLSELLYEAGFKTNDVMITNSVRCATDKPGAQHWKKCQSHLAAEIEQVKPAAIISLGAGAAVWLTGHQVTKAKRRSFPCTLDREVPVYPVPQPAQLFHYAGEARQKLRQDMVADLEWIREEVQAGRVRPKTQTDYQRAKTVEDVDRFLAEFEHVEETCFDLETPHLGRPWFPKSDIVACGLSKGPGHGRAIPLNAKAVKTPTFWTPPDQEKVRARLRNFFERKTVYGFNAILFDAAWIRGCLGVIPKIKFDAQLCAYLIDENPPLDLENLALRYTDMDGWKSGFNLEDPVQLASYLNQDVDATSRLRSVLQPQLLASQTKLFDTLVIPLAWTLHEMMWKGAKIARERIAEIEDQLKPRIEAAKKRICAYPEVQAWELAKNKYFNPNSGEQVGDLLENYFHLKRLKETDAGKFATDKEVLEVYRTNVPFCADLSELRALDKLLDTYVTGFLNNVSEESTAHTSFGMHTVTGRLNSSGPNLQNIPRDDEDEKAEFPIKSFFLPRPGYIFLQADFSQAELRILAGESGDKGLIQIFLSNLDAHTATAAKVYKLELDKVNKAQRNNAKRINFGIPYGMGEETLVQRAIQAARKQARKDKVKFTGKMRREAEAGAREFWLLHQQMFPKVWKWMRAQEDYISRGGVQTTHFGRRRNLGKADARAKRQSLNFPIQSNASDITLTSLVRCDRVLRDSGFDAYPLLTVHDSILFEVAEADFWPVAETVKEIMEGVRYPWMVVPMKVDLEAGHNWSDMVKVDIATREFK